MNDYIFNFDCYTSQKIDIKISNNPVVFDKEVFSNSLHKLLYETYDRLTKKYNQNIKCSPASFLRGPVIESNEEREEYVQKNLILKKDSLNRIHGAIYKNLEAHDTLLIRPFVSAVSLYIYHIINSYVPLSLTSKILIFATNHHILDGIITYFKYHHKIFNPSNVTLYYYSKSMKPDDELTFNYFTTNKINYIPITTTDININKKYDISIIDIMVLILELSKIRYSYLLQTHISLIILTLKSLNIGGTMILQTIIPNKIVFNFVSYISCYFDKTFVVDFKDNELYSPTSLMISFIVFQGYKGDSDINELVKINNIMYELDPTGGYLFDVNDEVKKEYEMSYNPKESAKKYMTNIITINDNNITKKYKEYKEYIKMKMIGSINNFDNQQIILEKRDDIEYTNNKCAENKLKAIYYAKKYDFPLLDWFDKIPSDFFNSFIVKNFSPQDHVKIYKFNKKVNILKLDVYSEVKCDKCSILKTLGDISESAYMYVDAVNYDAYKQIELLINNKHKKLNNLLRDNYNININGHVVSRAWIKFYELLYETGFLNDYDGKIIKIFFICEAPGNFINSMNYYIKNNTKIKDYQWTAQSLAGSLADFYDSYGFIKATIKNWDMGIKGTGDIFDYDNFMYYYKKYKDVDCVIGDCGEAFSNTKSAINKNLSVFQLLYALLLPKEGGRFVIKSYSANENKVYLALLYVMTVLYEKVMAFKSNTNFWSPEVYIIGMGFKGLNSETRSNLLELAKMLCKGEVKYPIKEIPDEFIDEYYRIMNTMIIDAADTKKFFVFLAQNNEMFNAKNKNKIIKSIEEKNDDWMKRYLKNARVVNNKVSAFKIKK